MRLLRSASLAALALAATTTAYAKSEVCHAASEKQIASLFDRWNASLQTGDPKKVVANYAKKSVLLPTVSNKPRLTAEAKEDYFEHFLERKPVGSIDSRSIEIDCNSAIDVGLYTFKFADGSEVKARYTFTYKWNGRQWLISSHHSSAMPEKN
ncbi:SgcJ/EcaC family oxidoreductase [Herbaspirillum sp.]|uniref:SgcJ/EcaC family oxidoreductase n=1 Tax=Herbaspirillum sp. TaxID=1890675 RepID=UPI001B17FB75|nr:SgcJ/EcaC family oxidoreductase [Herbaspirillum sp.]MBO9535973.1 SgcJ/EcaC family oxidoreductase [Herbaspirillum sp.]